MSKQVNFFGEPEELQEFHEWLLREFPSMAVIPIDRGSRSELAPMPVSRLPGLDGMVFLVPEWGLSRFGLRQLSSTTWRVEVFESPVIEYTLPKLDVPRNMVSCGRLYWGYRGPASREEIRDVDRILNRIRKQTRPVVSDRRFRLTDQVIKNDRLLDYGFGVIYTVSDERVWATIATL
jgi:hypothetical protein